MSARGFTLFELLITLLILVLLLTIGVPSLSQQVKSTRTKAVAQELLQSVHQTRTLAVSRNQRATLRHKGSWEKGWQLFVDGNSNGDLDSDEEIITEWGEVRGVRIYTNTPLRDYVSFIGTGESRAAGRSDGGALQMGGLRVCTEEGEGYQLALSRGGRMRLYYLSMGLCTPFQKTSNTYWIKPLIARKSQPETSEVRSAFGNEKLMFSGIPGSSSGASAPWAQRRSMTRCTSTSGAEAPAVIPIFDFPCSHSHWISSGPSIRYASVPQRSASSRRRLEFELASDPTTSTRSHSRASWRTASWRLVVA